MLALYIDDRNLTVHLNKGVSVAEQKAPDASLAKAVTPASPKPILFIILSAFNIVVVLAVGILLFLGKKKEEAKPTIDQVVEGEQKAQAEDKKKEDEFIGKVVPMETFLVNLAGSRGGKLAKITMDLEVSNGDVMSEIDRRKPQIRDIIIILLSSKSYDQVSAKEGKDFLRDEIRDRVNSFLTKGKIKSVYFTEFLLN